MKFLEDILRLKHPMVFERDMLDILLKVLMNDKKIVWSNKFKADELIELHKTFNFGLSKEVV